MSHTTLMPYQPDQMSPSQLAAVSYLCHLMTPRSLVTGRRRRRR